jgi:hypothetical protein
VLLEDRRKFFGSENLQPVRENNENNTFIWIFWRFIEIMAEAAIVDWLE